MHHIALFILCAHLIKLSLNNFPLAQIWNKEWNTWNGITAKCQDWRFGNKMSESGKSSAQTQIERALQLEGFLLGHFNCLICTELFRYKNWTSIWAEVTPSICGSLPVRSFPGAYQIADWVHFVCPGARGVFGGQVLGQALKAATETVPSPLLVHSLHSYFLLPGDNSLPVIYQVLRTRDGRSFCTRIVQARQRGKTIFILMASFQRPGMQWIPISWRSM